MSKLTGIAILVLLLSPSIGSAQEREKAIVLRKVPGLEGALADGIVRIVRSIRELELKKAPSIAETLDWARTLVLLGIQEVDAEQAKDTLHILLKYQSDITKATKELSTAGVK